MEFQDRAKKLKLGPKALHKRRVAHETIDF
jgi:hypothetical protein